MRAKKIAMQTESFTAESEVSHCVVLNIYSTAAYCNNKFRENEWCTEFVFRLRIYILNRACKLIFIKNTLILNCNDFQREI